LGSTIRLKDGSFAVLLLPKNDQVVFFGLFGWKLICIQGAMSGVAERGAVCQIGAEGSCACPVSACQAFLVDGSVRRLACAGRQGVHVEGGQ